MANNRPSKQNSKKASSSITPLVALGFAATIGGITGTPALSNTPTSFVGSNPIITTIPYKRDDEDTICLLKNNSDAETFTGSININYGGSFSESSTSDSYIESGINSVFDINFDQYLFSFINEVDRHPDYLSISTSTAMLAFVNSARKISKIPFIKSSIDLLPEDGFKFVLKLSDSKILMASQYMMDTDIPSDNVVFSVFENRKLVESNVMQIDDFVNRFNA